MTQHNIDVSDFSHADLREISQRFETGEPRRVFEWATATFGDRFALATGFGAEGCVLVKMLAEVDRSAQIFFLDTGVLFPETYDLRERLQNRYGVSIKRQATALDLTAQSEIYGANLWEREPDKCCNLRKVEPLRETLRNLSAWATAIRRDQSATRTNAGIVERDKKFGLVKINPLANWTSKQVWRYIVENDVPYNPLHDQGFRSIGCLHCTSAVAAVEDDRAGRWRGTGKTECGLHQ